MMQVSLVGCTIEAPILTGLADEKHVAHHLHQVEGEAYLAGRYVPVRDRLNYTNEKPRSIARVIVGKRRLEYEP